MERETRCFLLIRHGYCSKAVDGWAAQVPSIEEHFIEKLFTDEQARSGSRGKRHFFGGAFAARAVVPLNCCYVSEGKKTLRSLAEKAQSASFQRRESLPLLVDLFITKRIAETLSFARLY